MLYKYLLELGYNKQEIELIINKNLLFSYDDETLYKKFKSNYEYLLNIGYSKNDLRKITFTGIFVYNVASIERKINYFINLGYSLDELKKMSLKHLAIF